MIELDLTLPLASFRLEVAARFQSPAVAILGPSGSGKTSLLEAIAGLRRQALGMVRVGEMALLDSKAGVSLAPEKRRVGYVPQDALLFPHLDVADNVRFGCRGRARESRVFREAVEILDIGALLPRFPATLSGGERQRVALARALATNPRLLLLDEPLAGIDAERKARILPYLLRIRDKRAIPLLYVTHHVGEAEALAGEALLLRDGRVEACGSAREVLSSRSLLAVDPSATFENVVEGITGPTQETAGAVALRLAGGATLLVPAAGVPVSKRAVFAAAAEEILLSLQPLFRVSARNILVGEILGVEASGDEAMVRVAAAGVDWRVHVTAAAVRELRLAAGLPVWLAIKTQSFRRLG